MQGCSGTHSFRKVLTAMAVPWGATCSVVASARWPCSCRKRQAEPTATRSQVPANWGQTMGELEGTVGGPLTCFPLHPPQLHLLPSPPPTTSTCLPLPLPQLHPLPPDTQLLPASLYPPPPAQKLHVPPSTPHNFYLLSIKIGLGLDGADGGCRPAWPLRPLAQRASCQEQSQEGHSPRGQHGGGGRVAGLWEAKGSTTKSQDRVYSAVTEPSPGSPCPSVASPTPALGQPHPPPPASS